MGNGNTTAIVKLYLGQLNGEEQLEPVIRHLLDGAVLRLQKICAILLHRQYYRLTRSPLNLQTDELLSAVVERLLKALRQARPQTVREFFALASQHMRWELNDLARRLDHEPAMAALPEAGIAVSPSSNSGLSHVALRMLETIDCLPDNEREAFDLVRIQGLSFVEAADLLGVTSRTIQRRLDRSLILLTERLEDLKPEKMLVAPV
jgi:RNA polymerase sigma factor, sigma-70 family